MADKKYAPNGNEIVSIREFARRIGLSDTAVRKRIYDPADNPEGIIVNGKWQDGARPALLWEIARSEWIQGGGSVTVQTEEEGVLPPGPAREKEKPAQDEDLLKARKAKAMIGAQKDALLLKKLQGELVLKSEVYKLFFEYGQKKSEALLQIPDRVVHAMRNADNDNIALQILYNELQVWLVDFSNGPDDSELTKDAITDTGTT